MTDIDTKVQNFLEFSGPVPKDTVLTFIKNNDNDVAKAVDAYFTNNDPNRYAPQNQYDERAWDSDRYGHNPLPYQGDNHDATPGTFRPFAAPSRPPSRSSQRGPLHTETVDPMQLAKQSSSAADTDLQKATKQSLNPQQTGIVNATGREYLLDPEPEGRRRMKGEPAFIKPLRYEDFSASLITILYTIPQCRHALLSRRADKPLHDYGYNVHWWEGEPIETRHTLDCSDSQAWNAPEEFHELQRLMTFLHGTNRSYGSIGALHKYLDDDKNRGVPSWSVNDLACLRPWEKAAKSTLGLPMFITQVRDTSVEPWISKSVWHFDITTKHGRKAGTLYDSLDDWFWSKRSDAHPTPSTCIESCAPVIVMRIRNDHQAAQTRNISVPATWYADRYLLEHVELIKFMRSKMTRDKLAVEMIDSKLRKIQKCKYTSDDEPRSASELLQTTLSFLRKRSDAEMTVDMPENIKTPPAPARLMATRYSDVLSQLENISNTIDARIESLNQEKETIQAGLKEWFKLLTDPEAEASPKPENPYILQGVATFRSNRTNVTYACYPQYGGTSDESTEPQWWRMTYDVSTTTPFISKEKVGLPEVLIAAGAVTTSTLLVYANPSMITLPAHEESDEADSGKRSTGQTGLLRPLQHFIDLDNQAFRAELEAQYMVMDTIEGHEIPELDFGGEAEGSARNFDGMLEDEDGAHEIVLDDVLDGEGEELGEGFSDEPLPSYMESGGQPMVDSTGVGGSKLSEFSERMKEMEEGKGEALGVGVKRKAQGDEDEDEEMQEYEDVDMAG